jgi:putative transposase
MSNTKKDNYPNGYSHNTIRTEAGELNLDIPRDKDSSVEPCSLRKIKLALPQL